MSDDPPRRDVKMIHEPSGEKLALESALGSGRNGLGLWPSASAKKISLFSGAKLAKAISYCGKLSACP